jgi:hypothetical protein
MRFGGCKLKKFLTLVYTSKLKEIVLSGSLEDKLIYGPDPSSSDILTDQVGYHVIS